MFGHAGPGNMTNMAHPYIHTWLDTVSKRDDNSMYVYFCPCWPRKSSSRRAYIHTQYIHTYIHTYIHLVFARRQATIFPCMFHFRGPCRGNSVGPAGNLHGIYRGFGTRVFMYVCLYVGLTSFYERIETYIHTSTQTNSQLVN